MVLSKLLISVNNNEIEFAGNFLLADVLPLIQNWFRALPGAGDQARVDALVTQLRQQNDGLASAVSNAHQGTTAAEQPQE